MRVLQPRRISGTVVVAAAMLLAACGNSSSGDGTATDTTAVEAPATEATTAPDSSMAENGSMAEAPAHDDDGLGGETHLVDVGHHPAVSIRVAEGAQGWVVEIETTEFTIVADGADIADPSREGHAHVYVDGLKIGRAYASPFPLGQLSADQHTVRVELSTYDHQVLTKNNAPVDAVARIQVSGGGGADSPESQDGTPLLATGEPSPFDASLEDVDVFIEIQVREGEAVDPPDRVEVEAGLVIGLLVDSDALHDVHVHGYDILRRVSAGEIGVIAFTAEIPGVFEIELEGSRHGLIELLIR
jgi:hypothetical protein